MPNIDTIRVNNVDYNLFSPEIYSSQETVIGTWFGEPVYRKVLSLTAQDLANLSTDSSGRYLLPVTSVTSNLDMLLRNDILVKYDITDEVNNRNCVKCCGSFSSSSSSYEVTIAGIGSGNFIIKIGTKIYNNLTSNVYMIFEYTKTISN